MLAEQEPAEQHAERRHQEVVGARSRRARQLEQLEPEQIGEHRDEQHEIGHRGEQSPGRHDVACALERDRERQDGETRRHALHAIANPKPASRRKLLEQICADDERHQRHECKDDAAGMVQTTRQPALHDEGHAADAENKSRGLLPGHPLVEEHRGKHRGQHRIGADHQRRQAGRNALQADVTDAEIGRLVGDAEHSKQDEVAAAELERNASERCRAEHHDACQQEPEREQQEGRTVRHGDLGDPKRRGPQQTECHNHER